MALKPPVMTIDVEFGWVRYSLRSRQVRVGDRLVPPTIEIEFPGAEGQPALDMLIEIVHGVPRCTALTVRRAADGREVRQRDLRAIELETWVEEFVALCSAEVVDQTGNLVRAQLGGEASHVRGVKTIRDVRKGSRRPLTDERKRRVAEVYNAHESGGIEAVEGAFAVSRSTAVRYIKSAREAGLIENGGRR